MIRVLLIQFFLFFLPFAIYAGYLVIARKQRLSRGLLAIMPVTRLIIAGIGLVIIGLIVLATYGGSDPGGTYTPAVLKDGKIVPGHID